jgi:hypothetical protein
MTRNLRSEQFLAKILPTVGMAWATRKPQPVIVVEPTRDAWVINAADALALAWASRS